MKRVFGSSEKKEVVCSPDMRIESQEDPERTPELLYDTSNDQQSKDMQAEGNEFTIPPEYKQAYANIKAVTEEQYESMTTNIFSHHHISHETAGKRTVLEDTSENLIDI